MPAYYINDLSQNITWTGTTGLAANVTYTYNVAVKNAASDSARAITSQAVFTSPQRTGMEQALQAWENVANINFINNESSSASGANLVIRQADLPSSIAGWLLPTSRASTFVSSDLVVDSVHNSTPSVGTYAYKTMMHEVGHAIGLKHPGDYGDSDVGPFLPAGEDTRNTTIMSYNEGSLVNSSNNATTPMIYDIATAQYLYGANTNYNAGDTAYVFSGVTTAMTIWDGNGIDIINGNAYNGGLTIDLREGINNVTRIGNTVIWMAFGANIENATAGGGQDTVYGNTLNNVLYGSLGGDMIYGHEGSDTTYGNQDNDTLYGGSGNDVLYGGKGDDLLIGGGGVADGADSADLLYGGESADVIYGNAGDDTIIGGTSLSDPNDGADTIYAGLGNDIIYGNGGNDLIYSNAGNDMIYGGAGNNIYAFNANDGADTVMQFSSPGSDSGDMIYVSSLTFINTDQAVAATTYNVSGAVIALGNGNSITIIGIAANALTTHDFLIF